MRKYKLTANTKTVAGIPLHQIQALRSFGSVQAGDLGGWIEKESNLSQEGHCWVSGDAQVYGDARVVGDAQVFGDAWVSGNAQVFGDAWVSGNAQVYGDAQVYGNAWVYGDAWVFENARVYGNAQVYGDAQVSGNAQVFENAKNPPQTLEQRICNKIKQLDKKFAKRKSKCV